MANIILRSFFGKLKYLKMPLLVLVVIVFLFLIWQAPEYILKELPAKSKSLIDAQNELRKTLIQIVAGIGLLYALLLNARRTKAMEEGQITERFTKAVEQLGNNKLEIRLGGIYALERIAKDSEKDHWAVMEVLSAFVRENSKVDVEEKTDQPDEDKEKTEASVESDDRSQEDNKAEKNRETKIGTDIQAILTVIGRRKWIEKETEFKYIDLQSTHLQSAALYKANLQKVVLYKANLQKASLWGSNLQKAVLMEANLSEANLNRANLNRANLSEADLSEADLNRADLSRADLSRADLSEADLSEAFLWRTKNLTIEQLSAVKTLWWAILDPSLLEQVEEKYPQLLARPKEEDSQ